MGIDSKYCKAALFSYLRFTKQASYLASECGDFSSDILFVTKKRKLVEVEVKVSKSDFRNDFKKYKHEDYHLTWEQLSEKYNLKQYDWYLQRYMKEHFKVLQKKREREMMPSQFYFAVPSDMVSYVINHLNQNNLPYGVLEILDDPNLMWTQRVKVVKRATKLHSRDVTQRVLNTIAARMSSELANLWQRKIK